MIRVFKHPGFLFCCSLILLMMGTAFRNKMPNDVIFPLSAIAVVLLYAVFAWRIDDQETEERLKIKRREFDFIYTRVCEYAMDVHSKVGEKIRAALTGNSLTELSPKETLQKLALDKEQPEKIRANAACLLFYIYGSTYLTSEQYKIALSDSEMIRGFVASGWIFHDMEHYAFLCADCEGYISEHFDDDTSADFFLQAAAECGEDNEKEKYRLLALAEKYREDDHDA